MKSIVLMGIKHCGKSTQGKLLSKEMSVPFFDTDDEITELTGKSPRQIYTEQGKQAFMDAEEAACKKIAENLLLNTSSAVIATGGGICTNKAATDELRKIGTFVFLNVDERTAANRIIREIKKEADGSLKNLPAYIAKENPASIDDVRRIFHEFYTERKKLYQSLCDIEIKIDQDASKKQNLDLIISCLSAKKVLSL